MLTAVLLAHVIAGCAPEVGRRTMSSIVAVESGGDPLAIHDNTTNADYRPASPSAATALASGLIGLGHSVDLGLAQINSTNLPRLGLSARTVFDPCTNMRAGATILSEAYGLARSNFGPGQFALRRAIGAYNTGSLSRGDRYIASVVAAAGADSGVRGVAAAQIPSRLSALQLPWRLSALQRSPGRVCVATRSCGPELVEGRPAAEAFPSKRVAQLFRLRRAPAARLTTKPAPKSDTSPNDAPVVVTVTAVPVAVVSTGTPNF
jgi:type IV secretion system protein VirB1